MHWGLPWYPWAMKPPLFMRPLTDDERLQLEADRRTVDAFRVRRAHIVLASARRMLPKPTAQLVGCSVQTVRNVIHALNAQGGEGLERQANRPKTVAPVLDAGKCERLQHILHQSPRLYGQPTGVWTLALAADVCYAQGVTERLVRDETIRRALKRLETNWKRAKHWITRPEPPYVRKKSGVTACARWRSGILTGAWAVRMRCGGAAMPSPISRPGPMTSPCA